MGAPSSQWIACAAARNGGRGRPLNWVVRPHETVAICPHCRTNSIGALAKSWSSAAHPTMCSKCGGLSYIANPHGTAAARAGIFVPVLAIVLVAVIGALWAFIVAVVLLLAIVAYEALSFYRTPMIGTTETQATVSRQWERVGVAILGIMALLGVIAYWSARAV